MVYVNSICMSREHLSCAEMPCGPCVSTKHIFGSVMDSHVVQQVLLRYSRLVCCNIPTLYTADTDADMRVERSP